jgi:hypothetical protein
MMAVFGIPIERSNEETGRRSYVDLQVVECQNVERKVTLKNLF